MERLKDVDFEWEERVRPALDWFEHCFGTANVPLHFTVPVSLDPAEHHRALAVEKGSKGQLLGQTIDPLSGRVDRSMVDALPPLVGDLDDPLPGHGIGGLPLGQLLHSPKHLYRFTERLDADVERKTKELGGAKALSMGHKSAVKRNKRRTEQERNGLYSQHVSLSRKLMVAEELDGEYFYFPTNMDFRGRSYPMPPTFNHLGADIDRGMLSFHRAKPLGEAGVDWLKIQVRWCTGCVWMRVDEGG